QNEITIGGVHKIAITAGFRRVFRDEYEIIRDCTWRWLRIWSPPQVWLADRERALEKPGRFERGAVARKASDDLHAERQAARVGESGHIDAGRTEQRPQPV